MACTVPEATGNEGPEVMFDLGFVWVWIKGNKNRIHIFNLNVCHYLYGIDILEMAFFSGFLVKIRLFRTVAFHAIQDPKFVF